MNRKKWTAVAASIVLTFTGFAQTPAPTKQTIHVEQVALTIDDPIQWTVTPYGDTALLSAPDGSVSISFMSSPIRGCQNVMGRLGKAASNDFVPGWYATASVKPGSATVCLDLKSRTLLAILQSDLKEPAYRSGATVLQALAVALKK